MSDTLRFTDDEITFANNIMSRLDSPYKWRRADKSDKPYKWRRDGGGLLLEFTQIRIWKDSYVTVTDERGEAVALLNFAVETTVPGNINPVEIAREHTFITAIRDAIKYLIDTRLHEILDEL